MLDLIKGRRVEDALNTLAFSKKRIAAKVEKLVRSAVENAVSIAGMILTTEALVTDIPEEKPAAPAAPQY